MDLIFIFFSSRQCAEKAISALDGARSGSKNVRLSWRPSNVNKQVRHLSVCCLLSLPIPIILSTEVRKSYYLQPPRWRSSERIRAIYHPYAHHYGVRSCTDSTARGNYAYEDSMFPSNVYDLQQHMPVAAPVAAPTHYSTGGIICPLHHMKWPPVIAENHRTHQVQH